VRFSQTPSGSLTVTDVPLTLKTAVNGSMVLTPIKSPGTMLDAAEAEVVITEVVVLYADAVMVNAEGIAPTH
jgi:hypothetical protein